MKIEFTRQEAEALAEDVLAICFEDDEHLRDYLAKFRPTGFGLVTSQMKQMDDDEFDAWIDQNYTRAWRWEGATTMVVDPHCACWRELLEGMVIDLRDKAQTYTLDRLPDLRGKQRTECRWLIKALGDAADRIEAALGVAAMFANKEGQ